MKKINLNDGLSIYCLKETEAIVLDEHVKGYLSFGRYDEKRPSINEKGNPIPWQDLSAMESIDLVIQYQDMNLKKLTDSKETINPNSDK